MQKHNPTPHRRRKGESTMRVRVGAFELHKRGVHRFDPRDPYHFAVSLSWPQFALLFLCLNLLLNMLFACLYVLQPGSVANARPGTFIDVFFFSMETLATVGYGVMSPATLYGHVISASEIIVGMAFTAIMTGLTFVRFSRGRAKILYAKKAVIANYNGAPTLMIRIANGRTSMMTNAHAQLSALIGEHTQEGQFYRRVRDLQLSRSKLPMFPLTWTLMHEIDATSPLHGWDSEAFAKGLLRLVLAVEVHDLALGATVNDIRDYGGGDIAPGMRYADAVSIDEDGNTIADLGLLSEIEPDMGTSFA